MYERFTDSARRVMQHANAQAHRCNSEFITPEHIALSLLEDPARMGPVILAHFCPLDVLGRELTDVCGQGNGAGGDGRLPQTPPAKQVIQCAMDVARAFNHNFVGTEHLAAALGEIDESPVRTILARHGATKETLRERLGYELMKRHPLCQDAGHTVVHLLQAAGADDDAMRRAIDALPSAPWYGELNALLQRVLQSVK